MAQFTTLVASDAPSDVLMADVDNFRLDVVSLQFVSHYTQGRMGTAVSVRTSVNQ